MGIKNDGKGMVPHQPPLFSTFFAAGNKRFDPNARADGKGGFLRKGYYWCAEGFVQQGPFSSRRVATRDALETIRELLHDT